MLGLKTAIITLTPDTMPGGQIRQFLWPLTSLALAPWWTALRQPCQHILIWSALRECFNCHFSFRGRVTSQGGQAGKRRAAVIRGDEDSLHAAVIAHTLTLICVYIHKESPGSCLWWAVPAFGSKHREVLRSARPWSDLTSALLSSQVCPIWNFN